MAEIRMIREDDREQAVRLSDAVFRDEEQVSMAAAFPDVFSAALGQSFGAFEDGKLVCFLGLVPSVIRIGEARVRTVSLGSVCTHPDARGKGYASAVLDRVIAHADKSGAALMLVSGNRSLYERAGCFPFGSFRYYKMTADDAAMLAARLPAADIREAAPSDWFALAELAGGRLACFEQSITDLARLIANEAYASCLKLRHRTLVAEREGGGIAAFAVVAVPGRLQPRGTPFAVEWAGDPQLVAALFAHAIRQYGLARFNARIPWHETELIGALDGVNGEHAQNLGTIRIIHPVRLFEQLAPYLQARSAGIGGIELAAVSDGVWRLSVPGEPDTDMDLRALTALLFDDPAAVPAAAAPHSAVADGAAASEPDKAGKRPPLPHQLRGIFPLPFPSAGGLNYV